MKINSLCNKHLCVILLLYFNITIYIVYKQDAKLDLVLQNMIVLRDLSSTIHDELLVQGNMIDSIDKKVDNVVGKFKVANNKMKELLEEVF